MIETGRTHRLPALLCTGAGKPLCVGLSGVAVVMGQFSVLVGGASVVVVDVGVNSRSGW